MANKLSTLLRKVFLGSLAGIAASNTSANINTFEYQQFEDESNLESITNKKPDMSPKLLLKMASNDEMTFMSHRSHRSHSSHRSHYSSYSGGGGSNAPKSNSGIKLNNNNSSGTVNTSDTETNTLQLGSRTLKIGMSGTDVTELINILLKKEYLKLEDGGTHVTGVYTYDETVLSAIKKFQSDNGLTSDGVCGSTTIYYLKNK